jgi:hypothetical protein
MADQPRTDQEQWAADLLRLLGFDVKMNHWPKGTLQRIEIDVWGRLGPLQVAVECKKYGRGAVGASDIEYFHEKLEMLGQALGIFVANTYSEHDLILCRRFGILPLTSRTVSDETAKLEQAQVGKKHLAVSTRTWQLLMALMRFAQDWEGYFDPTWPFHREIYATEAFELHGLIQTQRGGFGDFRYEHTEVGQVFFSYMKGILEALQSESVTAMERIDEAADLIVETCGVERNAHLSPGYNRLIVQGLGLQDMYNRPTHFGTLLASVLEDAVLHSRDPVESTPG